MKRKLYLPEDRINLELKVVNFSSSYFPYINDIIALFLILSTLVKIHSYTYIIYICIKYYIYIDIEDKYSGALGCSN